MHNDQNFVGRAHLGISCGSGHTSRKVLPAMPGIGPKAASAILTARQTSKLTDHKGSAAFGHRYEKQRRVGCCWQVGDLSFQLTLFYRKALPALRPQR